MSVTTWAGIVESGQIRLAEGVHLAEKTLVYVVVPSNDHQPQPVHIFSPHLANPKLASDFTKAVTIENANAGL